MSLLVYALLPRGVRRPGGSGMTGERLRTIPIGALAAVVGEVAAVPRPSGPVLQRYDRVVRSLWDRGAALLPVRFGTVVRDPEELAITVRARQQTFRRRLTLVRRRAQMTVRIVSGSGTRGPERGIGTQARSSGRRYLEARARLHDVPGFAPVRRAARRWIRAERIETHGSVTTIYHLVPRSQTGRYRRAVERAAAGTPLRVHVSGPWPAYAFADGW